MTVYLLTAESTTVPRWLEVAERGAATMSRLDQLEDRHAEPWG